MELANQVLTVRQLADYLHCHTSTVYRLLRENGLPGFKLGKSYRFVLSDIETWVHDLERRPGKHATSAAMIRPKNKGPARAAG